MELTNQEIKFLIEELEIMSKEQRSKYNQIIIANLKAKLKSLYEDNSN